MEPPEGTRTAATTTAHSTKGALRGKWEIPMEGK